MCGSCIGALRKLVVNLNCVQCVIQHARAMNCLKSQNLVVSSDRVASLDLTRFTCSDETRRLLPGVVEGVLLSWRDSDLFRVYRHIIVCVALCTKLPSVGAAARKTLMELLPAEKCKRCMGFLSNIDSIRTNIGDIEL